MLGGSVLVCVCVLVLVLVVGFSSSATTTPSAGVAKQSCNARGTTLADRHSPSPANVVSSPTTRAQSLSIDRSVRVLRRRLVKVGLDACVCVREAVMLIV